MTALVLAPATVAVIERVRANAAAVSQVVDVLPLESDEDRAKAGELLRAIATISAEGEAARKKEKAPHLAAGREVDAQFAQPMAELGRVEGLLRRRIEEAALRRASEIQEAQRALQAAVKAADPVAANTAALAVATSQDAPTLAGIGERWTWEIAGVRLEDVPREFLCLDLAKVRAVIGDANRSGSEPSIPGIVFERKVSTIVRRLP